MNDPFEYVPEAECDEAFARLMERVEEVKSSDKPTDVNFCRELMAGKMLGVLIAADNDGVHHTLNAFSGQLGDSGFHYPGFVEPVFDYLQPEGTFKTRERDISLQSRNITSFENEQLPGIKREYDREYASMKSGIDGFKTKCRESKQRRDKRRNSGNCNDKELEEMLRQSQFEKAELHRLKKRLSANLQPYAEALREAQRHLAELKEKRRRDSELLQQWLFSNFKVLNARGESKSLADIFAETPMRTPPSGAGECCAPKLLQAAYLRGWHPLAIAEYWYGRPKEGEIRIHGQHYPACRGKCMPVLGWMMQGLEVERRHQYPDAVEPKVIFENEWFCVVDKPSGMLSVPGKGQTVSVEQWLADKYGPGRQVRMAHRLDQDTSGLILATFGELPYKTMQSLFARRRVEKTYIADLEGDYESVGLPRQGHISLPLSPDWLDRPRQKVDFKDGKEAETEYEFVYVADGRSRIIFHPLTGRTHQLRVHAASAEGLGMPIVGDRLYGIRRSEITGRLHLHAHRLEFTFPLDGQHYCFTSLRKMGRESGRGALPCTPSR